MKQITTTNHDPDNPKEFYYVSCIDQDRIGLVAGPYSSYDEAVSMVGLVSDEAERHNPRAFWYAWGVSGSDRRFSTVFEQHGIEV